MSFSAIVSRLLKLRQRRGGGLSSYFGGDIYALESALADIYAGNGITGRAGLLAALEPALDIFSAVGPSTIIIVPSLIASRTGGPAPLAVHFDTVDTTHTSVSDTWKDIGRSFNYGDPGGGTWTYSGVDKNVQRGGAIGGHVYLSAGSFTPKCGFLDASGNFVQAIGSTITVIDADTYYAGTQTICISRTTDMTGAPAGATLITNATGHPSFSSTSGSPKRYLYRAGQDFSSFGTMTVNQQQNGQWGKFGAGAKPIVSSIQGQTSASNFNARCTVMDFQAGTVHCGVTGDDILYYGIDTLSSGAGVINFFLNSDPATNHWQKNCFIVNCTANAGAEYGAFGRSGRGLVMLGNSFGGAIYHCIRPALIYRGLISHNYMGGVQNSVTHQIKIHSGGVNDYTDTTLSGPCTQYVVVSYNKIGSASEPNPWAIAISPQNDTAAEGIQDVIVENNGFNFNFQNEVMLGGRRLTSRGNFMNVAGTLNEGTGQHTPPSGWAGPYYIGSAAIATQDPT